MKPCCEDLNNRGPVEQLKEDLTMTRCTECGCRHFELEVDPLELNLTGAGL